uniref:F-box/LRR-repeat protein 15-like leucin rich repeat domain-containing protein n=2 Tax=Clytia hemisphaerica TaxID=252671 RepID=A0A7M5WVS8_9CNID
LNIGSCYNVTDTGVLAIAKFSCNLKHLIISSNYGITSKGLSALLKQCTNLETLDIGRTYLSNTSFDDMLREGYAKNLKEIRLYKCPNISEGIMERLAAKGIMINSCF